MTRKLNEFCKHLVSMGWQPKSVVDVGVCYGTPELHEAFPDSYFVLFEPVPQLETRLQDILKKYNGEYHLVALGDKSGSHLLSIPKSGVDSSSLCDIEFSEKITVPVTTLDDVFAAKNYIQQPILLKTDCQGYDLNVIRGGAKFLNSVDLVIMEVNMFPPTGNIDYGDFTDIILHMNKIGFVTYDILGHFPRPYDQALGFVDVVFVKRHGWFRRHLRWN